MSWMDECWTWTDQDDEGVTVCGPCAKLVHIGEMEGPGGFGYGAEHHYRWTQASVKTGILSEEEADNLSWHLYKTWSENLMAETLQE